MKQLVLCLLGAGVVASSGFAGTDHSGKEMKQVAPPPCPEWYADREINVSLWGTYIFTGTEWANDRYIEADHAWGGGGDIKYFFMRYFGVGIEGWAASARQARESIFADFSDGIFESNTSRATNTIGAMLSNSLHPFFAVHFRRRRCHFWWWAATEKRTRGRRGRRFRRRPDRRLHRSANRGARSGRRRA